MDKAMSCCGAADYLKSRQKSGGHAMTEHHSMNKKAAATVKKSEARQVAMQDKMVAKDPKEKAIYAGVKSSKKPGGM